MPERDCSVSGCDRLAWARGWCKTHYNRWWTHGDPGGPVAYVRGDDEGRFWTKVDKNGPVPEHSPELGPCWLWTGAVTGRGYGHLKIGGRMIPAHRFGYELLVGPVPEGMVIDHLCRLRHCVRPDHLETVTGRENTVRGYGPAGLNARKTHCEHGHPLNGDNVMHVNTGRGRIGRRCLTCRPGRAS